MKKCNCPECNKELIRLEPFEEGIYEFWCDSCDIDIVITKNTTTNDEEINYADDEELVGILGQLLDEQEDDVEMSEKVRQGIYNVYSTLCARINNW